MPWIEENRVPFVVRSFVHFVFGGQKSKPSLHVAVRKGQLKMSVWTEDQQQ